MVSFLEKLWNLWENIKTLKFPLQKKEFGLIKSGLGGKTMTKFVGIRAKTYSNLINDGSEDAKSKVTKKCVVKRKVKFQNYKNCLESTQCENNINHLETKLI